MPEILFGKYQLGERIARGGMAEIYHAQVVGAGGFAREIVVKRILPDLVEDPEFREMFQDEAKLASYLDHPNIVQIFDFDHVDDSFFIAMEYVRGADFSKLIRTAGQRRERLPHSVVVFVLSEVLAGLRYAHDLTDEEGTPFGLVHRDISPANVLLSYSGAVKLADFGIAKAATSMVHTSAGILKGKYPYMSPEQAAGEHFDNRSDLFSVGIVLYQALVGRRPFRGKDTAELLDNVINGRYEPPRIAVPTLPDSLDRIVEKALRVDPDRRYQSAEEFMLDLRGSLSPPPARENLEQCLARLIPEKPRTLSVSVQRPEAAETVRASSASASVSAASLSGPSNTGERQQPPTETFSEADAPPTQASLNPQEEAKKSHLGPILGIIGVVLALAALAGVAALSGIFTPETATEPTGDAASVATAHRRSFTVLARRNTEQENVLRQHGLAQAMKARNFELRLMRFNQYDELFDTLDNTQVDLASIPLAVAKTLAQKRLIIPVDEAAGQRLKAVKSRFSPPALEVATVETRLSSNITFVPEYLEVHILALRASKVELARERWTTLRDEINEALAFANGRGLPEGYELEPDPSNWDDFDVFVLGYTWAHLDEGTQPAPRIAIRSASYWPSVEGMIERMNRHGQIQTTWVQGQPLRDVMTWLALHREHGLQREEVFAESADRRPSGTNVTKMLARGEIYIGRVNQLRCSEIRIDLEQFQPGFDADDILFAPLPGGVSVELDDEGRPARATGYDGLVNAWLWAIPRSAESPETSLEVALELVSIENQSYFANRNCWIPTNTGVNTGASGPIEPFCRRAIAPGLERLTRTLRVAYPPDGERLNSTVTQFERLWTDLFFNRGYRGDDQQLEREHLQQIIGRHVPSN